MTQHDVQYQDKSQFLPTPRTTVKRLPKRANYDREMVYSILDEGLVCHISFVIEGLPSMIPTTYGRIDDVLYIHGSPASRTLRTLQGGVDVCVAVTLIDGLVLARSAFHHSMNYRSVIIYGQATMVSDLEEKNEALRIFTDQVVPGRWADIRQPSPTELAGTLVLALPLVEVSAKVRSGPPIDDESDRHWPVWAGVIPLQMVAAPPLADPLMDGEMAVPGYAQSYSRP